MRVCVYTGKIPSTVFIERLIQGLTRENTELLLVGHICQDPIYPQNVKVEGYRNKTGKLLLFLRFLLLFMLKKRADWKKIQDLIQNKPHLNTRSKKINWYIKVLPVIWYKPDIFHLQWVKNIKEWLFLQEFDIKVVASLRGAHINYSPIASAAVKSDYMESFPRVDGFHGVSKSICSEAWKYGIRPERCKVIYSGLDLKQFTYQQKKQVSGNKSPLRLLSVGRPHWKKGYMYALDACHILQSKGVSFTYEIVGGISEEMLFQIHQLQLENITIHEPLPFHRVIKKICQSDLLLLPSVEEGIANVVLEAMALGTPVISTYCGGMPEVIREGQTGWLIPMRDPKAMAQKIMDVSQKPEEEIQQITRQARGYIEKHHTLATMSEGMVALYNTVKG